VNAIIEETKKLGHVSNYYYNEPNVKLAKLLCEISFAQKVFFCNSGAEANEGAFKFARRWSRAHNGVGATEIVALRGSFHGRLFASLAATDRPGYRAPSRYYPRLGARLRTFSSPCEARRAAARARIGARAPSARSDHG
jgi:acetylornithine/succinyldiaminopimelate/putrescine aminotransferase